MTTLNSPDDANGVEAVDAITDEEAVSNLPGPDPNATGAWTDRPLAVVTVLGTTKDTALESEVTEGTDEMGMLETADGWVLSVKELKGDFVVRPNMGPDEEAVTAPLSVERGPGRSDTDGFGPNMKPIVGLPDVAAVLGKENFALPVVADLDKIAVVPSLVAAAVARLSNDGLGFTNPNEAGMVFTGAADIEKLKALPGLSWETAGLCERLRVMEEDEVGA